MHTSWLSFSRRFRISLQCVCCCVLVAGSVPATADDDFLSKPPQQWTEAEALQVLNDSPWAHTITTTTQDFRCDYEHPAYPESYQKGRAEELDSMVPTPPATDVKPDGAEYLVRFLSVKPMQAAVERLLSLDPEKWRNYRTGYGLESGLKPTNVEERWYNPADEITIVIVLKRSGPGGASFRDYAFHRKDEPKSGLRHLWPCAAVKTANGVTTAVLGGPVRDDGWNAPKDIALSFPSTYRGKPLIAHPNEKLDFRFVANQRVFETTFYVNPSDLFDGTETTLHIPRTVDEPVPATVP